MSERTILIGAVVGVAAVAVLWLWYRDSRESYDPTKNPQDICNYFALQLSNRLDDSQVNEVYQACENHQTRCGKNSALAVTYPQCGCASLLNTDGDSDEVTQKITDALNNSSCLNPLTKTLEFVMCPAAYGYGWKNGKCVYTKKN